MKTNNWLIPFKGRNYSGHSDQNFLWQNDSIYIMDNHRAALWCWLQHMKKKEKYNFFHIDRHYDASNVDLLQRKASIPTDWNMSLDKYLELKISNGLEEKYTFVYDNYVTLFYEYFAKKINNSYFGTHEEGIKPSVSIDEVQIWKVPENLDFWLSNYSEKWIFNLDLDYFFCDDDESRIIMFSDEYINYTFSKIAKAYAEKRIKVLTIALSPEWTNGWEEAEKLCSKLCNSLKLNFKLPK